MDKVISMESDYGIEVHNLLFLVWSGLICNLFGNQNNILHFYTSRDVTDGKLIDIMLNISENDCNLQVTRTSISAR